MHHRLISGCFLSLCLLLCSFSLQAATPRNIVLMIGDGMGLSQISAAYLAYPSLQLQQFKTLGLVDTRSADAIITDSAAGATAMASGHKTHNQVVGLNRQYLPVRTVVDAAEENKLATGLVVTSRITHATPASFVAHVTDRGQETLIAEQMASSNIDLLFGSGKDKFISAHQPGSHRKDEKDPWAKMQTRFQVATTSEELAQLKNLPALALLALESFGPAGERPVSLAQMTQKALQLLSSNGQGFFLMVEGSQIDWAGHDNDIDYLLAEMHDFDGAIGAALQFAQHNPQTLVIVTADHETAGLSIEGMEQEEIDAEFTTKKHTATLVPIFAYGPGSDAFRGFMDNTHIGRTLIQYVQQADSGTP